jgi:hypothetical protein
VEVLTLLGIEMALLKKVMQTTIFKDILFNIIFNVIVALILFWVILGCLELG